VTPEQVRAARVLADLAEIVARRPGVADPQSFRDLASALRVAAMSGQRLASLLSVRDYLSMSETAEVTSISPRSLRRHVAAGNLPTVTVGRRRLVRTTDLTAFLESRRTEAA
jgi:excisionase family DNA binding protein